MDQPQEAIVRIINVINSQEVGKGVVIDGKYVFTCSHVVREALGLKTIDERNAYGKVVVFTFPYYDKVQGHCSAKVHRIYPVGKRKQKDDIAVLKIEDETLCEVPNLNLEFMYRPLTAMYGGDARVFIPDDDSGNQAHDIKMNGLNALDRLQLNMEAEKGWSGLPIFVKNHEKLIAGLIASDAPNTQSHSSTPSVVFALAGHHLCDILQELRIEEGVTRKMTNQNAQYQQDDERKQEEANQFVRNVWEKAKKQKQNGQYHLRRREVLVYAWLLQTTLGSIQRQDIYRCVDKEASVDIDRFFDDLRDNNYIEEEDELYVRLGKIPMKAIETVGFSNPPVRDIVVGNISGLQLLQFFIQLKTPPNDFGLLIAGGLQEVLGLGYISPKKSNNRDFYPIVHKNGTLICYVVVDTCASAYPLDRLRDIASASVNVRESSRVPVLLFAPNSVNVEVYRGGHFDNIFHVWSLSTPPLFKGLFELKTHGERLLEAFSAKFFPQNPRSDFSTSEWLGRVKQALGV